MIIEKKEKNMPQHIRREIENLKKLILDLSAMVEENVYNSVNSIGKRDSRIEKKTIESDSEVNEMEMNIEVPVEKEEIIVKTKLSMPSRKLKVKISSELLQELERMQVNFKLN